MINSVQQTEENSRIKRLIYQSWHRGCKETDEALGGFAKARLAGMPARDVERFEQLLAEDDWDIWNWLTGKDAPKSAYSCLIADIQDYIQSQS